MIHKHDLPLRCGVQDPLTAELTTVCIQRLHYI